ncbi:MAG: hypothetical protein ABL967_15775 [Bryobacteraceae bacterium]
MADDTIRILFAFALYVPCLVFPGYVLTRLTGALRFSHRGIAEQLLLSVPLSVAISPLLIYLAGRISVVLMWSLLASCAFAGSWCILADLRGRMHPAFPLRKFAAITGIWLAIGLVSLVDFQWNGRLYTPATNWDYTVRVAITDSISRTSVAPANPLFYPGRSFPLRYHYFWMLPASIVDQMGGEYIAPIHATLAGTLWSGLALMLTVVLYRLDSFPGRGKSYRQVWIGLALLLVTGLDIIPMLFHLLVFRHLPFTLDSWNEILAGWVNSVLWVPHHVAGLVACLAGVRILRSAAVLSGWKKYASAALAGAAFAGSAGLSIYICLVFAVALVFWGAIALWKRWFTEVVPLAVAGGAAAVFALPYLTQIFSSTGMDVGGFFVFAVRTFSFPENLLTSFHVPMYWIQLANFVLLPINYGLELGLFFAVGCVHLGRLARKGRKLSREDWLLLCLLVASLFVATFFRSRVIQNNDLGWRGILVAQFVLLLWSIDYVAVTKRCRAIQGRISPRLASWNALVIFLASLGLMSTLYGLAMGRAIFPALESGWLPAAGAWYETPDLNIGRRMFDQRAAAQWIRANVPRNATLVEDGSDAYIWTGLYSDHQQVNGAGGCGAAMGGTRLLCDQLMTEIGPMFRSPESRADIESVCERYNAGAIIAKDIDPVWNAKSSWVWQRHPVFANDHVRVFGCQR